MRQTWRMALRLSLRKSAIVLPKVLAREVRGELAQEPDELQVAAGFPFQQATRADAVEVSVDVESE